MVSKGCSPPLVVYNTLINGLCKAERFCHAYSFVKEMLKKDWKPDSITCSLLMVALNLWRQALDKGLEFCWENWRCFAALFKYEAVELNCLPNLVTHYTLMDGIYKASECEKASVMWACMFKYGFQLDIDTMITLIAGDVVFVLSWQYLQM